MKASVLACRPLSFTFYETIKITANAIEPNMLKVRTNLNHGNIFDQVKHKKHANPIILTLQGSRAAYNATWTFSNMNQHSRGRSMGCSKIPA